MDLRKRALKQLVEGATRSSERKLRNQDYLKRYRDENGRIGSDGLADHGFNRVLFALDVMGGEGGKSASLHLLTGVAEILIGSYYADGGD